MSKKVIEPVIIEQDFCPNIEVWNGKTQVFIKQKEHGTDIDRVTEIDNTQRATEVAKAIDPEYQKVIDRVEELELENQELRNSKEIGANLYGEQTVKIAKLVEALEYIADRLDEKEVNVNSFEFELWKYCNDTFKALQNNKNIEGL